MTPEEKTPKEARDLGEELLSQISSLLPRLPFGSLKVIVDLALYCLVVLATIEASRLLNGEVSEIDLLVYQVLLTSVHCGLLSPHIHPQIIKKST